MNSQQTLVHVAMVVDGDRVNAAPGVILIENGAVLAAGAPQAIGARSDARILRFPDAVALPAMVNAHAHLDLTHIGCRPFEGSFVQWIEMIRRDRCGEPAEIAQSVRDGIALSLQGGTALIGDIAGVGSDVPTHVLRESPMHGTSFTEFFGIGLRQTATIERMRAVAAACANEHDGVRTGLQPHAPYSCGPEVFATAASLGLPLSSHIAETPEEIEYTTSAQGPLAYMLRDLGALDDTVGVPGRHPIDALRTPLSACSWLLAHANYVDEAHIEFLSKTNCSIAYCPRASEYFGHPHDNQVPHRYQAMLAAGINVALGTDGLICLDTPNRISVLDEIRLLHKRDGTDAATLVRMATLHGALALQRDPDAFRFAGGATAGSILVAGVQEGSMDPLGDILRAKTPPRWLTPPWGDASIRTVLYEHSTISQI